MEKRPRAGYPGVALNHRLIHGNPEPRRARDNEVAVFDLNGQRIRRLGEWELQGLGSRAVRWDGRRDDGREAKAGVYWVRMLWPGGAEKRRVVKLN